MGNVDQGMTAPTGSGGVDVLAVLRRDINHATRYRCSAEGIANVTLAECGRFGRESDASLATVEAMAEALRLSAEAIENVSKCVSPELAVLLRDRARPARAALAAYRGEA